MASTEASAGAGSVEAESMVVAVSDALLAQLQPVGPHHTATAVPGKLLLALHAVFGSTLATALQLGTSPAKRECTS